jgi:hypothetical protein
MRGSYGGDASFPRSAGSYAQLIDPTVLSATKTAGAHIDDAGHLLWTPTRSLETLGAIWGYRVLDGIILPVRPVRFPDSSRRRWLSFSHRRRLGSLRRYVQLQFARSWAMLARSCWAWYPFGQSSGRANQCSSLQFRQTGIAGSLRGNARLQAAPVTAGYC